MKRIVVTDSTSDIPQDLVQDYGIKVMPMNVILDGKTYRDGRDISRADFYDSFTQYTEMTSAPVRYEDYGLEFLQMTKTYDEIFVIHCSQHLSETYATAQKVHREFMADNSCRVEIIDSGQCSMGLGMIVLGAAQAIEQGKSFEQVVFIANRMRLQMHSYMAIPTLKYLKKRKKINGIKALFGAAMGVKPVLEMHDGKMIIKSKLFGEQKNMILAMMDSIKEDVAGRSINLSIIYAGNKSLVENLKGVFETTFDCKNIYIARFSPSIALNTGPESYAVFFTVDE